MLHFQHSIHYRTGLCRIGAGLKSKRDSMHEKTLAERPGTGRRVSVATDPHTRGLIVKPADTFGDQVFAQVVNPASQAVPPGITAVMPVHHGLSLVQGMGRLQLQRTPSAQPDVIPTESVRHVAQPGHRRVGRRSHSRLGKSIGASNATRGSVA